MNRQTLKEEIQTIKNILKTPILLEIIEMQVETSSRSQFFYMSNCKKPK